MGDRGAVNGIDLVAQMAVIPVDVVLVRADIFTVLVVDQQVHLARGIPEHGNIAIVRRADDEAHIEDLFCRAVGQRVDIHGKRFGVAPRQEQLGGLVPIQIIIGSEHIRAGAFEHFRVGAEIIVLRREGGKGQQCKHHHQRKCHAENAFFHFFVLLAFFSGKTAERGYFSSRNASIICRISSASCAVRGLPLVKAARNAGSEPEKVSSTNCVLCSRS